MFVITGAAGFIGSCLIKKLNDEGHQNIIVVDRLGEDERWLNLRGLKYYRYVHADDFIQPELMTDIFEEGVEAVYHMGACSSTTEKNIDFLMSNNVEYSQILFSYCAHYDVPICYASSAATYGAGENGYDDNESEISTLMALNAYGYSKQLMDEWVLTQQKVPSTWFGVKFFNVYGPNEYHKESMRSVVHQAYEQIKASGEVKLFKSHNPEYKDGEQLRDFVYVKDVVDAMCELMHRDHKGKNGIYNIGHGEARSFKSLVEATFEALNIKPKINYIDMPDHLRSQYQYYTKAEMGKFQSVFPEFRFCTVEEGVTDYVQNHLENSDPYLNSRRPNAN